MRMIMVLSLCLLPQWGCATATYTLEDMKVQTSDGKPKPLRPGVSADAPGGDAFAVVVYYGRSAPLGIRAGADATALVNATAAAGAAAVKLALKVAKQ